ncbi:MULTISPECIES: aldehyde dehydrogenase family protein [unclassified Novosphingobium]|uniref:aldehyde dehydrogenase family protein n=1 Tax=unclassified Novosphingobium TaxID=2644732 RepID=UPI00183698AF|nr:MULTISPECIES: aldehyde dehydrogenase family protein [unclassified Novosphingobium]MBB3360255.1 phenylacetaldehyde dehydrogenase [Novosphingobium sp. BK256]MBB3376482.1 phenylacetaldehyde dehydrogenase [Novosphingobium sp. BK280]MBB3380895.1 phenylacetaldehyde dehydrogenase [Novosphingobium sp. BK258]MBB3422546.1 phenylacetaldehyde dehydrogenase [Novosphingobium sp. BK267]MBB3451301.1 phenylacetaldehyde dehydrogenase [Novosphingobium sp. BK352]
MNEMTTISREQRAYSPQASAFLARKPQLFINNEWVDSSHDAVIEVEDPSSGKIVGHVVDASDKDVDRAVAAARTAFDDGRWSGLPPMVRDRTMNRLADLLEANADLFAELEAIDNGKPKTMAGAIDIPGAISQLRFMAGWASKISGETTQPYTMPGGQVFSYTVREPVGVCAQIVPWNFPLLMASLKIAPALAAGCTLVLKPAEQTSLTALKLADLVVEAGFPAGVINIITGNGHTAGDRMVKHPDVDKVAFTGSTEIGKLINRNATASMKRVTLELGGKSPVVVMPDVDVAQAAPGAAGAIFFNSGQVCVAGSRLFAHKSVFDQVLEGMAATAPFWSPRPSLDPEAHMGPLVSKEQHERVMGYIEAGKRDGASVVMGGDVPASDGGYYVNPTILANVNPQMSVVREEIFGPVVVAQRFEDLDEVARMANDTCFGLGAGIWTKDVATMHKLAAKIKSGTVWGNCHAMIDTALPFGGYKESGLGREQGRQGVEAYLETKTVIIQL